MPLSFDQHCLHLIFDHTNAANPIPARKYGKLQNIVSSVKDFYVCLFVLLLCFTFLSKTNDARRDKTGLKAMGNNCVKL